MVKETQMSWFSCFSLTAPEPPQGLRPRAPQRSVWVCGTGRWSRMPCLPLRPTVFPNPGPGPPGPGEVVRGTVLL